ncbi:MAG: alpha/beta fold hydrolase [Flavobacteriales bacterium]|nr:alpha/beta fold hydrolase [Flavobacteriales bacterium]
MELNYKVFGEGEPLIILHGLFGSLDNWNSLAKIFGENHQVFTLDVRNHGRSPHSVELNYDLMLEDLNEFMEKKHLKKVNLIGHSMGGKMAMSFATVYPEKVNNLIIVDIGAQKYPPHHLEKIEALQNVDLDFVSSRKDVDEQIKEQIPSDMLRNFLLKNLYRNDDAQFAWRFNLDSLASNLENIFAEVEFDKVFDGPALFIKGGKSDYIDLDNMDLVDVYFADNMVKIFEDSGHWLHAQEPQRLVETINKFITDSTAR